MTCYDVSVRVSSRKTERACFSVHGSTRDEAARKAASILDVPVDHVVLEVA